ncbi:hypothetical protein CO046_01955 [Candidatus Peregrinibacteria bacterium CG_4_9_14_0_2_um_filter_53_11]|nr:MAG: hypothetical protein CO046_01955 [Candidatus Peregrinibacteria bacterium CG_4_9_14_0_2_um_filter_53_11]
MIKRFLQKTQQTFKALGKRVADLKKPEPAEPKKVAPGLKGPAEPQKVEVTISASTAAKVISVAILLFILTFFLYSIRDILILFFVSLLFAAALDPLVDTLERHRIPRSVGILLIYLVLLLVLALFISNLVPVVASQISELAVKIQELITNVVNGSIELPGWLEPIRPTLSEFFAGLDISTVDNYKDVLLNIAKQLSDVAGNVLNGVFTVFNGLFNTVIVLVLTFLMTIDEHGIDKFLLSLFPARYAPYIEGKSKAIKKKMGDWLRGQVVLCFLVGILTYVGLLIIGLFTGTVQYAATIALVAGFTELIPYVGPIIAWILALPMVANQSLLLIVWVSVLMYIVQLIENNLLVPVVMKHAVGISPIFVMFAMFVGYSLLGILGMVLAVPVATAMALFVTDYAERAK